MVTLSNDKQHLVKSFNLFHPQTFLPSMQIANTLHVHFGNVLAVIGSTHTSVLPNVSVKAIITQGISLFF